MTDKPKPKKKWEEKMMKKVRDEYESQMCDHEHGDMDQFLDMMKGGR